MIHFIKAEIVDHYNQHPNNIRKIRNLFWSPTNSPLQASEAGQSVQRAQIHEIRRTAGHLLFVESLKEIAPQRRFSGYRLLLKAYVSGELRQDEARYTSSGPPLD
ncbi:hypothetical protein ACSDBR_06905 [Acidithiobacillus ferriphilus]|uniref:hypothetical protein n=1 Tax=Acidithiobacillus ferriphilus TaxID=1689834 RepID=UPI001C07B5EA|nr:hypothetical protein [Acidithiobacillus ferriphilus]MBU2845462.1 hypothetical protein [Acidithiobacillus ferriphilus]MEB8535595.1 hypothetical protein [Acidithiobacillus ferriphilus]